MATTKRAVRVTYTQPIEITVVLDVDVDDNEAYDIDEGRTDPAMLVNLAEDKAQAPSLEIARRYLSSIGTFNTGDPRVSVEHSHLDGIGADDVEDVTDKES